MGDQQCCVVVLISGNGNNLQALIDASSYSGYSISHVISNNPSALGLERAKRCEISSSVLNHRDFGTRGDFDRALQQAIDDQSPDLVVLADLCAFWARNRQEFFWQNAEHPPKPATQISRNQYPSTGPRCR